MYPFALANLTGNPQVLRYRLLVLCLAATWAIAPARAGEAVPDLKQIMADPDWIGPPVAAAWWQLDGQSAIYRVKRTGADRHDLRRIRLDDGTDELLEFSGHAELDGADPVLDRQRRRALFARDGNLFLRHLDSGRLRQLTRSTESDSEPLFGTGGGVVFFRRGEQWWSINLDSGAAGPVTDLRMADPPDADPDDDLEQMQLRLFERLAEQLEAAKADAAEDARAAHEDPTRAAAPWYLGDNHEIAASSLSPDGRWLLLAMRAADAEQGRSGRMPDYVTRSGYVEVEDVRTLVGRTPPAPQNLWLLDLREREKHELDFSGLQGLETDPLADLKRARDIEPHDPDNPRAVLVTGIEWHPDGHTAAVQVRAIDNKDRWLATVAVSQPALVERHRLHDPAWVNWTFNEFGWLPESDTLWLLSEETGFSHLYTIDLDRGRTRRRTEGRWEVSQPAVRADGSAVLFVANRTHPTEYDLYRLDLQSDRLQRLTELKAVESFTPHPLDERILVRYSSTYTPAQLGVLDPADGSLRELTDTRTGPYREIRWQPFERVGIESTHGAEDLIWTKFYPPRTAHPSGLTPLVVFVHGAGYLQNTHHGFPQYFREQMFHNLLTAKGYMVLDMDYRASRGYGRNWRTAIYRRMGTPELEDLIDGVNWAIEHHGADPRRVGVYGGSYGGFMAFMALFNAPEVFAAGAALRPVTDWAHYSHSYTSNILNTPQVDPEAYAGSSPIEFAGNFGGHLLITHGMLDDNVFYQDVVRLAQRLIELEKENWELASYPLEPHGFRHPASWLDQYRRILRLFETTIGAP